MTVSYFIAVICALVFLHQEHRLHMSPLPVPNAFSVTKMLKASWNAIKSLKPTRPMKYPYTFSAKIAQFPWRFYYENQRIFKYYPYAVLMCMPLFWYISRLANSPANKAKWAEIRRKEMLGEDDDEGHH